MTGGIFHGVWLATKAVLTRPFHWAWRLVCYGLLAFVVVVLGASTIDWYAHNGGGTVGDVALRLAKRKVAATYPLADPNAPYLGGTGPVSIPQSDLVTGKARGKRTLLHPLGGGEIPPVKLDYRQATVAVQLPTAAQEAAIGKATSLPAPAAGEHRIWGPGTIPCRFVPGDRATYDCPDETGHLLVRGNAEVLLDDKTGKARLVFVRESPGFFELSHFSEGWRIGGGPTFTYSTAAAGLGASVYVVKDLVRTGRVTWPVKGEAFAEPAPAGALGSVAGRVLGARLAVQPEWRSGVP